MGAYGKYQHTVTLDYSSNSSDTEKLKELPTHGKRGPLYLTHITGHFRLNITSAATSDAITGQELWTVLSRLFIGNTKNAIAVNGISGVATRQIQRSQTGRAPRDAANIAANSNTTNTPKFPFVLFFADPRAESPGDGAVPAGYLSGGNVKAQWAASTVFGTGQTVNDSTQLILNFHFVELDDEVRSSTRVVFEMGALSKYDMESLDPGVITDLVLFFSNPDTAFASDDFTDFSFFEDSTLLVDSVDVDELVESYNEAMIVDAAALIAAPEDTTGPDELPLVWPGRNYKISELPMAENAFKTRLGQGTGAPTITTLQYVERRLVPNTDTDVIAMLSACGCDTTELQQVFATLGQVGIEERFSVLRAKTISKVPLTGSAKAVRLAPYLPARYDQDAARALLARLQG